MDPALVGGMKWRQIGPFRGGRVLAVAGVPGDPNTYYFGAVAGGVFKSTNAGMTLGSDLRPRRASLRSVPSRSPMPTTTFFMQEPARPACAATSLTATACTSRPTPDSSWTNVGLKDSRHIGAVIIDPRNPDIALVAALGHAWGPNAERGVFRTADGGKTWQKVLYKDENTGAIDVVFDPKNSSIVYAAL